MNTKPWSLIIRLASDAEDDQFWWLPDGGLAEALDASEAAKRSQQVPASVLLDASCIRIETVELPPGVKPAEAGLLLEESLCQPLEDMELITLNRQGRTVQLAVVDQKVATEWQQRILDLKIIVKQWIPETLAFRKVFQQPVTLVTETGAWLFQPESLLLLHTKQPLLLQDLLQGKMESLVFGDFADQPSLVPWLAAQGLPKGVNLWPRSLSNRLQLPTWLRIDRANVIWALPWMLLLMVFVGQSVLSWQGQSYHSPSVDVQQLYSSVMGGDLPDGDVRRAVDQRLDRLANQKIWQQQRLDVWQELQQALKAKTALSLQLVEFNEQGVRFELTGVTDDDHTFLRQLPGRWSFEGSQAVVERSL